MTKEELKLRGWSIGDIMDLRDIIKVKFKKKEK